jgi:hypothetical protein
MDSLEFEVRRARESRDATGVPGAAWMPVPGGPASTSGPMAAQGPRATEPYGAGDGCSGYGNDSTPSRGRGQAGRRGAHRAGSERPASDDPKRRGYPARHGAPRPRNGDSPAVAARILSAADYQAAALTQRAAYQAAMITRQVAHEATESPARRPAEKIAEKTAGGPGARTAKKPAGGRGRQVAAIRVAVIATSVLFAVPVVASVVEIHEHGFAFFVFRSAGTGETRSSGLQEDQGPGQPDAPKPTPGTHKTVTVHKG